MSYRERARKFREVTAKAFSTLAENGDIPSGEAAQHPDVFDAWEPETDYKVGNIRVDKQYDPDRLFKCRQNHTSQAIYPPHTVPSLWESIPKPGEGDHDHPIPFDASVGMELVEGLYYSEDNVLYRCIRSSGAPIYNRLNDLIGIYVRVSNEEG